MDDLLTLHTLLYSATNELQSMLPPELSYYKANYFYTRRANHLRREINRLELLIELERANHLAELFNELKKRIETIKKQIQELQKQPIIMHTESILTDLKGKFPCKNHPTDKKAIVIYNIDLCTLQKICKKYRCSGVFLESHSVITNFYKY